MSNYATNKKLDHAAGIDISDLAAKKDFIALKAEVDELNINNLVNVLTSLNNLKAEVDDLDVGNYALMFNKCLLYLSFSKYLKTKCVLLNDESCMVRSTLIDLNPVELKFYSFMISLDNCSRCCLIVSMSYHQKYVFQKNKRRKC